MTEPTVTEADIRAACEEAGVITGDPQGNAWHAILALARRIAAEREAVPVACAGCEGKPAPQNSPCAVCGLTAQPKERQEAENAKLREALNAIIAATHSHIDGRDLLADLHPRKTLDVKRRVDGREMWFEADWLSDLWTAIKTARAALETDNG